MAAVLLAALAVLPRPASAANPIDGGNPTIDRDGGPDSEDDFSILDRNNPISGDGVITSWTIYAKARIGEGVDQNQVKLKIYRESGGVFTVVGESAFVLPDLAAGEQTFTLATPIPVLAGDLIGMRVDAQGVVPYSVADGGTPFAADLTRVTLFNIDATDAATGDVETFDSSGDRMYSIRVDGTDIVLSLDPASDANIIRDSHTVTASVGSAVAGLTVHFEVTAGPNAGDSATADTDETGAATFTYPGDGGAGTDEIAAWLDLDGDGVRGETEPSATATKLWVSDAVSAVSLSPATDSNPTGTDHTVTATITPKIAGVTVRFEVSSGPNAGDNGSGITATNGKASFTYTGDGGTGSDLIFAWADLNEDGVADASEPKAVAVKEWLAGVEPVTALSLSPTTDSNPIGTPHTVTATVTPQVEGVVVRFEVSAGPNAGDSGTATTDAGGEASFTYTGDGGAGGDLILAWADLNDDQQIDDGEPKAVALKEWVGDGAVTSITLSPVTDSNPVDTDHTVTATVSPQLAGVIVHFEVSAGPNAGDSGTATTDASGEAAFTYTGDGGAGTDLIVAYADLNSDTVHDPDEPTSAALKEWVPAETVTAISLAPTTDSNPVGTDHTVTATVTPQAAGVVVHFEVSAGPNAGDSGTAITDANGEAAFTYTGDGGVGTDLITAYADLNNDTVHDADEPTSAALKEWVPAEAVTAIALAPTTDSNPLGTDHTVTATVSPQLAGVAVRFEVSAGPNAGDTGTAVTDANGQATFTYTGDGGEGSDLILAWADLNNDGVLDVDEPKAIASKQWELISGDVVTSITLAPASDSNPVGTGHTVTATVSPKIEGVLVRFEVNAGPNAGDTGSGITDANGKATFTYTGDGGEGSDLILAWVDLDSDGDVDASEPTAIAVKQWVSDGAGVPAGSVQEICENATFAQHPSLAVLCSLLDRLPPKAREAIERVILRRVEFDKLELKIDSKHDKFTLKLEAEGEGGDLKVEFQQKDGESPKLKIKDKPGHGRGRGHGGDDDDDDGGEDGGEDDD